MRIGFNSSRTQNINNYYLSVLFLCLLLSLLSVPAKAVVINFDDLVYVPTWPEDFFADHELTDEYQEQGLLIRGGFLSVWDDVIGPTVSGPNYLLAGHDLRLRFVGELPTFVSMYISASMEQAVFLGAFNTSGLFATHQTDGWAGSVNNSPYVPNQFVSFTSPDGISEISIGAYYFMRTGAIVDDLTFTYATQVPEPSSVFLFGFGLLALAGRVYAGRSKVLS